MAVTDRNEPKTTQLTRLCFTRSWAKTKDVEATSCSVLSSACKHHQQQQQINSRCSLIGSNRENQWPPFNTVRHARNVTDNDSAQTLLKQYCSIKLVGLQKDFTGLHIPDNGSMNPNLRQGLNRLPEFNLLITDGHAYWSAKFESYELYISNCLSTDRDGEKICIGWVWPINTFPCLE